MKPSEILTRPHPVGWANFDRHGRGKEHWFGPDGVSLCGRHANRTFNILSKNTTDGCAKCRRKFAALAKARESA